MGSAENKTRKNAYESLSHCVGSEEINACKSTCLTNLTITALAGLVPSHQETTGLIGEAFRVSGKQQPHAECRKTSSRCDHCLPTAVILFPLCGGNPRGQSV